MHEFSHTTAKTHIEFESRAVAAHLKVVWRRKPLSAEGLRGGGGGGGGESTRGGIIPPLVRGVWGASTEKIFEF